MKTKKRKRVKSTRALHKALRRLELREASKKFRKRFIPGSRRLNRSQAIRFLKTGSAKVTHFEGVAYAGKIPAHVQWQIDAASSWYYDREYR